MGGACAGPAVSCPNNADTFQRHRRTRIPATSPRSTERFHTFIGEAFLGVLAPGYSKGQVRKTRVWPDQQTLFHNILNILFRVSLRFRRLKSSLMHKYIFITSLKWYPTRGYWRIFQHSIINSPVYRGYKRGV